MGETRSKQGKVTEETQREAAALKAIWERTKLARVARGVGSQAAFGAEFDIGNQGAVWQFLEGRTALSMKAALGFARGLECRVEDFSQRLAKEIETIASASLEPSQQIVQGAANPHESSVSLAHSMSLTPFNMPSIIQWRELMELGEVPEWFTLEMPDDALAPDAPRGAKMIFQRSTEGVAGKAALVEDRDGERHVRWYTVVRGKHWLAKATGSGYVDLDSERDGLRVLAVARFRE